MNAFAGRQMTSRWVRAALLACKMFPPISQELWSLATSTSVKSKLTITSLNVVKSSGH